VSFEGGERVETIRRRRFRVGPNLGLPVRRRVDHEFPFLIHDPHGYARDTPTSGNGSLVVEIHITLGYPTC